MFHLVHQNIHLTQTLVQKHSTFLCKKTSWTNHKARSIFYLAHQNIHLSSQVCIKERNTMLNIPKNVALHFQHRSRCSILVYYIYFHEGNEEIAREWEYCTVKKASIFYNYNHRCSDKILWGLRELDKSNFMHLQSIHHNRKILQYVKT